MKKRIAAGLLGGVCVLFAAAGTVRAMTWGYDLGSADTERGSTTLYITEDCDSGSCRMTQEGTITEYGDFNEIRGLSEEEKKKLENWHREEMREQLAYLEIYGVTYDADADEILYQGKNVRWLIDRQIDNTCMAIEMPEGEIDLYTVRSDDFRLTGVRIATEEEYQERTEKGMDSGSVDAVAEEIPQKAYRPDKVCETAVDIEADAENCAEEYALSQDVCETTAAEAYSLTREEQEEQNHKIKEYAQAGIGYDAKNGCWLWNDKQVYLLMDENGALYQNGSDEAVKNKIYIIVKRNSDGGIKEAKQVTMEEVMKEKMLMDQ
ncbi:MAG: hypothetical protein Q4C77_09960 [Eubacteriales bacterium]|nr:hypothetical protein [Eubacteriales bacterium]